MLEPFLNNLIYYYVITNDVLTGHFMNAASYEYNVNKVIVVNGISIC